MVLLLNAGSLVNGKITEIKQTVMSGGPSLQQKLFFFNFKSIECLSDNPEWREKGVLTVSLVQICEA